jgi:RNA polymerase sigma-70 factor (ECF subfamily)
MDRQLDCIELVEKARAGDGQSLNQLAELARERLRTYVYRLTLKDDLTQEIVQESLLEMCKVLGKLRDNERFWPWLYGIATNKLHRHYRTEKARKNLAALEQVRRDSVLDRQAGLENLVGQELKGIISNAMKRLRTRHKAVLVMRCYDDMSYAEIAESMGCSEFSTRMLFVRAKRALQKELAHSGLGKGSLLAALIVFGKMTAPSEAAAAELTVSATATKVGVLAGLAGLATTKTAIVSLTAAGVLTVGAVTATPYLTSRSDNQALAVALGDQGVSPLGTSQNAHEKYLYYFPEGPQGPVMIRAELTQRAGDTPRQLLQNDQANYSYRDGTVSINNYRMWSSDLSVMRLPTDSLEMAGFLTTIEGKRSNMEPISAQGRGLLIVAERDQASASSTEEVAPASRPWAVRQANVLDEGYFQNDWSAGTTTVDNRDQMHARGWTYFTITGRLGSKTVTGAGQMPFTYAASKARGPWLTLRVADTLAVDDSRFGAFLRDSRGAATTRYPQGSFFKGLARPWMGLHTLDTVRRDAADKRARFETQLLDNGQDVRVTVQQDPIRLVYTIDLATDVVKRIEFFKGHASIGYLEFQYVQGLDSSQGGFQAPSATNERVTSQDGPGILWLVGLAKGVAAN